MFKGLWKLACYFEKFAALKWGPESKWVPEEFRKLKPFEEFTLEEVQKDFAQYGLSDFREKVEVEEEDKEKEYRTLAENLLLDLRKETNKLSVELVVRVKGQKQKEFAELEEQIEEVASVLNKLVFRGEYEPDKLTLPKTIRLGKKQYPQGSGLFKVYKQLEKIGVEIGVQIEQLEKMESFKRYSKRETNYWIVFSTKANDLVGIAERGSGANCQSLFDEYDKKYNLTQYNQCLVGTILSKYVGVIYATSGSDYQGRGERMLARCLVRLIWDKEMNQIMIFLDKIYPESAENKYFYQFYQALAKRSSVPVTTKDEYKDTLTQLETLDEREENLPLEYQSYKDFPTLGKLKAWALSDDEDKRMHAAKVAPIDSEILYILLDDSELTIAEEAALRIDLELLKKFIDENPKHILNQVYQERVESDL